MALKYINRTMDLDGNSIKDPLPASFFDGEASAHMFTIAARRGGQPVTLSGTVSAVFLNKNDTVVTLTGSISNGAAVVTLSDACYAVTGPFILTISVAGAVIYECNSRIKRRQSSTIYDPTGELSPASIAQDIADMEEATTAANTAAAAAEAAAEAVGADVDELQALVWEMLDHEAQNYSGVTASHFAVGPSGKWSYSDTQSSYTIPLDAVKIIKVTGGTNGSIVAFINSNTQVSGENVDFSTAYSQRITLTASETKTFVVSGDMNYFYALLSDQSGTDKTPTVYVCYLQTDTTLAARHMPAEAKATGDAIEKLCINITHDFSGDEETNWVVTAQNIWSKITDNPSRSKTFRIPKNATKITVTGGQYNGVITCLKSYAPAQGAAPDYSTGWARTSITAGATYTFDVGGDCNYLYCTTVSSTGNNLTPTVVITAVRAEDNMLYPVDTETAESESGKHDRADEIMMALNAFGVCRLAPGVYYTGKSIVMPAGTMLQGSGAKTIIRPLASVAAISTITMSARCTIKDLALKGSDSGQRATSSGSRNGIEWTGETMENGVIQNCTVMNFSGAGIYMHDTTRLTKRNLAISDCYILGNRVGIDIFKRSEFHKICNCTIYSNGIGYRNRGGNNNICNCGIENNVTGILIDDDDDDTDNTGHGTITGCSVNHSGPDQYTLGYGLVIRSTGINNRPGTGRMIVSNCNIYYSKLRLENTNGNVFTGCGFGTNAPWEISGTSPRGDGGCSIFNGCMVKSWDSGGTEVTDTNNTAKIVNCFDRAGNAYSA